MRDNVNIHIRSDTPGNVLKKLIEEHPEYYIGLFFDIYKRTEVEDALIDDIQLDILTILEEKFRDYENFEERDDTMMYLNEFQENDSEFEKIVQLVKKNIDVFAEFFSEPRFTDHVSFSKIHVI